MPRSCSDPSTCPCNFHSAQRARERALPQFTAAQQNPAMSAVSAESSIQDKVIADIEARKIIGLKKYGTLLQPFNGRSALIDAYQEAIDLTQYLRQAIEERNILAELLGELVATCEAQGMDVRSYRTVVDALRHG